jgi:hypothetical protein
MAAAEVVNDLSPEGDIALPTTERQARELARIPDVETRREVWQQVVQDHGDDVTGPKVRDAVADRLTPKTTVEWEATPISILGDDLPPPPYIPPAEEFMHKLTGVAIRALSTSIADAVEGIGDGQLSDTDLLPKFRQWLSDVAEALAADQNIRRIT